MNKNALAFFIEQEGGLFGPQLVMDVRIANPQATLSDLLEALSELAEQQLADCRGCSGCCRERAPLIAADLALLAPPGSEYPAHAAIAAYAELTVDADGAVDITLRRAADGCCEQLNREEECCNIWPARPFVCRSHFCLPRSSRLEELRQQVANNGENELGRLILTEEGLGAPPLGGTFLANLVNAADYPPSPLSHAHNYHQLHIRDCVDDELWQQLLSSE